MRQNGSANSRGFRFLAVYGGIDYQKQMDTLQKGVDVLIGTPGRLIDYFKQHVYSLKKTRYLIIDEADRMFDMGFIDDLRYLLKKMPPYTKRQSMLFSATLSYRVMELAYEHMNLPEKISITPEKVTVEQVEQVLYHVGKHEKIPLLLGLLKQEAPDRALIFVNTRRAADMVVERLNRNGWKVAGHHRRYRPEKAAPDPRGLQGRKTPGPRGHRRGEPRHPRRRA